MKTLKPILLLVSGMALAFVFAFKVNSQESAKEYATMYVHASKICLLKPSEEEKKVDIEFGDRKGCLIYVNDFCKDGWQIKSIISGSGNPVYTIYFERDKK